MAGEPLKKVKEAAKMLINDMIDLSKHRIGLVEFGSIANSVMDLSKNKDELNRVIDTLSAYGSTDMAGGISVATNHTLGKAEQQKVIIILTDGRPDHRRRTEEMAAEAKNQGVRIITIGIGGSVDRFLLRDLATTPQDTYQGDNFDQLSGIFRKIANALQKK